MAFTVSGGRIFDGSTKLQIRGVGFFGFTSLGWPQYLWQMNWQAQLNQIKALGFNCIRNAIGPYTLYSQIKAGDANAPSFVSPSINPDLIGKTPLQILDMWMAYADSLGLYVFFDYHSVLTNAQWLTWFVSGPQAAGTWNGQPRTQQDWINDWVFVAQRYASNPHFMGCDIYNEPNGVVRWDSGDSNMTNAANYWRPAVNACGAAILAANPNVLIGVQGVGPNFDGVDNITGAFPNWAEDLQAQGYKPLSISATKLVLMPHTYGPEVAVKASFNDPNFPTNLAAFWQRDFGFLFPTYAVIPGEWGGQYGVAEQLWINGHPSQTLDARSKPWMDAFVAWMKSKGMSDSFYWAYFPNSSDVGGILGDNLSVRTDKLALLQSLWGNYTYEPALDRIRIDADPGVDTISSLRMHAATAVGDVASNTFTVNLAALSWLALPNPITITAGSFFDLSPYIIGTPVGITDGVLPSGVTISLTPTPRLVATAGATGSTNNNVFTMTGTAGVPLAPGTPTLTSSASTQVVIDWPDNSPTGLLSYKVYRATGAGAAGLIATVSGSPPVSGYTDNTVSASTTYTYTVDGVNAAGEGPTSTGLVVTTPAAGAVTADSDWTTRSTGPGVVWAHDFRTTDEVDQFCWVGDPTYGQQNGDDPNKHHAASANLRQITTDGIGTVGVGSGLHCMELIGPGGDSVSWWRPFSPLSTDRGATGLVDVTGQPLSILPRATVDGGGRTAGWHFGNYATNKTPSYDGAVSGNDHKKDGHDFWVQWRLKVDVGRKTVNTNTGTGKSSYVSRTERSLTPQEINVQINDGTNYPLEMYTGGSPSLQGSSAGGPCQNGYLTGEFTNWSQFGGPNWITPYGIWDTFMIHVIPGHENDGYNQNSFADNEIYMWAAHQGATSWTQIWKRSNYRMDFKDDLGNQSGWNAFIASVYTGGGANASWYHRYAQIIFSQQQIALPLV